MHYTAPIVWKKPPDYRLLSDLPMDITGSHHWLFKVCMLPITLGSGGSQSTEQLLIVDSFNKSLHCCHNAFHVKKKKFKFYVIINFPDSVVEHTITRRDLTCSTCRPLISRRGLSPSLVSGITAMGGCGVWMRASSSIGYIAQVQSPCQSTQPPHSGRRIVLSLRSILALG